MKPFMMPPWGRHGDPLLAAGLFTAVLGVYLRTLCPTIYWGDCGELAAAAYTLGNAHPTGYPLWLLLAKAWSLMLPAGSVIWRMNVLSAVLGALAVVFLFGAGRTLGLARPIALAVAACFAFTHTFWQQCLFAETYTLTGCYTCALLFLAVRWRARGCQSRGLRGLAFVGGLAMTNGQINTLFLPGVALFVLWARPELRRLGRAEVRREWLLTLGVGALPLLLYAYLPLRALADPPINWGDPRTPYAFWFHVSARPYADRMFSLPWHDPRTHEDVQSHLAQWAHGLGGEMTWPLVVMALWGAASLWRRAESRPTALLLCWVVVADVAFTVNYNIYNAYIYYIPCYAALAVLAGGGLSELGGFLGSRIGPSRRPARGALAAACLSALVGLQLWGHWAGTTLHNNWACHDYGHNLLATVPQNGVFVDNGLDESKTAMTYLQSVEGRRPDVVYVSRGMMEVIFDFNAKTWANRWVWRQLEKTYPEARTLFPDDAFTPRQVWDEDPLRRLMAHAVASGRPVVVLRPTRLPPFTDDHGHPVRLSAYLDARYDTAPIGLLTRLYPRRARPAPAVLLAETRRVWRSYSLRGVYDGLYLTDGYLTPMAIDYADAGTARAELSEAQGDFADAADAYAHVLRLFNSPQAAAGLARCAQAAKGRLASGR